MISAFGVEHGDISKATNINRQLSLLRVNRGERSRQAKWAGSKLHAKDWGQAKGRLLATGKTSDPTGQYWSGQSSAKFARDDLEVLNTRKPTRKLP